MKQGDSDKLPLNFFARELRYIRKIALRVDSNSFIHDVRGIRQLDESSVFPLKILHFLVELHEDVGLFLREEWRKSVAHVLSSGVPEEIEHAGDYGRWALTFIPETDGSGVLIIAEDLAELHRLSEQVRVASTLFERIPDGLLVMDATPRILYCNEAVTEIAGYSASELIGRNPLTMKASKTDMKKIEEMWRALQREGYWAGEVWAVKKGGMEYPQWLVMMAVRGPYGKPERLVAVFRDITRSKQHQQFTRYLSNRDVLTGLTNRTHFRKEAQSRLTALLKENRKAIVAILDLDGFNLINRTYGHMLGDAMLQHVAERLKGIENSDILVGRLGGDDFAAVHTNIKSRKDIEKFASRLIGLFDRPFLTDFGATYQTVGVGIAQFPKDGNRMDVLLKNAEIAMHGAKTTGRNRWKAYSRRLNEETAGHLQLKSELFRAVENEEFMLEFQPFMNLETGHVDSAEALVRWRHPRSGQLMPSTFIPLAEESDLILPIGKWVLKETFRQLEKWQKKKFPLRKVSLNVSNRQLYRGDLVTLIQELLGSTSIRPEMLELELTESAVIQDVRQAVAVMDRVRKLGVRIALDDFGSGYSSLNYLRLLPIDTLKIDQSFVKDVLTDPGSRAIIRFLVGLSRELGLNTVAEGVESDDQLTFLKEIGCSEVQGFLISIPLPVQGFETFVKRTRDG